MVPKIHINIAAPTESNTLVATSRTAFADSTYDSVFNCSTVFFGGVLVGSGFFGGSFLSKLMFITFSNAILNRRFSHYIIMFFSDLLNVLLYFDDNKS